MPSRLSQPENDFIDRLGQIAEAGGLTRITGRIWGLLIVTGEALSAAEIAERLQISRGSVSMGLKVLDGFDLLDIKSKSGDRQAYHAMRDHPYSAMLQMQMKRAASDAGVVRLALQAIERPEARKRLEDLRLFYEIVEAGYATMLERIAELKSQ